MNAERPHECGARTRAGAPCKRRPSPGRNRCRLHGGRSPWGVFHPNFRHGLYSRYSAAGAQERARCAFVRRVAKLAAESAVEMIRAEKEDVLAPAAPRPWTAEELAALATAWPHGVP